MKLALPSMLPGVVAAWVFAGFASAAETTNWPTWRGAEGTGAVVGARPPLRWSDTQNIKWKTAVPGLGHSTPIIWQNRIYLLTAIATDEEAPRTSAPAAPAAATREGDGKAKGGKGGKGGRGGLSEPKPTKFFEFVVLALDRGSGKVVWQKTARREVPHEGKHATNSFASGSPVTDGERLYVPFGSRGFYCFDLQGKLIWEKDFGDMRTRASFGEGASPALAGDKLIITWDQESGSFIVALDKKTGAGVWRKDRDEITGWTTPLVVKVGDRLQAIVAATKRTRSYDTATGDVVWEAGGLTENVIPTPVTGHGMVYVTSGYRGNSIQAIKLTSKGDVTGTPDIVWSVQKGAPYVPSPVLSGERLYTLRTNDPYLSCINALTGKVHYQEQKIEGLRSIYASLLAANGHLYVTGRDGTVVVVKDAPKYEVVATNKLDDPIDASPVILGRELYLRGHQHLYCIAEG